MENRVTISDHELLTSGAQCQSLEDIFLTLASSKGCPIDGVISPDLHPDYDYTVERLAGENSTTIKWKLK